VFEGEQTEREWERGEEKEKGEGERIRVSERKISGGGEKEREGERMRGRGGERKRERERRCVWVVRA